MRKVWWVDNKRGLLYIDTSLLRQIENREIKVAATNAKGERWHSLIINSLPAISFLGSVVESFDEPVEIVSYSLINFNESFANLFSETLELEELSVLAFNSSYVSSFSDELVISFVTGNTFLSSFVDGYSDTLTLYEVEQEQGIGHWTIGDTFVVSADETDAPSITSATISPTTGSQSTVYTSNVTATGDPTPTIARQWQRGSLNGYNNISGATGTTRTASSSDVGYGLRVRVTATNSEDSVITTTDPVPVKYADARPQLLADTHVFIFNNVGTDNPSMPILINHHGSSGKTDGDSYNASGFCSEFGLKSYGPWFDSTRFNSDEYQRGDARHLEAPLVDAVLADLGRNADVLIYGHSAGGQWLSRVAAYGPWPVNVQRYVIANPSTWVFPVRTGANGGYPNCVDYPYGFDSMGSNATERDAAIATYLALPITVYVGEDDIVADSQLADPSNSLGQGAHRRARAENVFEAAQDAATRLGVPCNWIFVMAQNVGHAGTSMLNANEAAEAFFP